ncbi:hypothetical protein BKA93DRAFT_492628 [Sparassis latifolia]
MLRGRISLTQRWKCRAFRLRYTSLRRKRTFLLSQVSSSSEITVLRSSMHASMTVSMSLRTRSCAEYNTDQWCTPSSRGWYHRQRNSWYRTALPASKKFQGAGILNKYTAALQLQGSIFPCWIFKIQQGKNRALKLEGWEGMICRARFQTLDSRFLLARGLISNPIQR